MLSIPGFSQQIYTEGIGQVLEFSLLFSYPLIFISIFVHSCIPLFPFERSCIVQVNRDVLAKKSLFLTCKIALLIPIAMIGGFVCATPAPFKLANDLR
eukprot:SAG11_NODE_6423_length_1317_cov_1.053366_3_plen_98_part_00